MIKLKRSLTVISLGLLVTATTAKASSPKAWKQHQQEVMASCLKVTGLRNAKPLGEIVTFSDNVGYDALLVGGNYPQPHMKNKTGKFICLFNRRTRKAYISEANQLIKQ